MPYSDRQSTTEKKQHLVLIYLSVIHRKGARHSFLPWSSLGRLAFIDHVLDYGRWNVKEEGQERVTWTVIAVALRFVFCLQVPQIVTNKTEADAYFLSICDSKSNEQFLKIKRSLLCYNTHMHVTRIFLWSLPKIFRQLNWIPYHLFTLSAITVFSYPSFIIPFSLSTDLGT
jgi:hypothetical protein